MCREYNDITRFESSDWEQPLRLQSDTGFSHRLARGYWLWGIGPEVTGHLTIATISSGCRSIVKVLHGEVRLRVREIIRQVCAETGAMIINGVLSRDHDQRFVEIPPHVSVSDIVRRDKGFSSRKIKQEFEHTRKSYWGQRFWWCVYFSTTSGIITHNIAMR